MRAGFAVGAHIFGKDGAKRGKTVQEFPTERLVRQTENFVYRASYMCMHTYTE